MSLPLPNPARGWLLAAVGMAVVLLIAGSVLTTLYWFSLGVEYGGYKAEREALARQVATIEAHAAQVDALTRSTNQTIATATAAVARAQLAQRRLQQEFDAYVQANPHPECRLPDAFGVVWNHANADGHPATERAPAAGTDGRLPAAAAAVAGGAEQPLGQPPAGGRAVPKLRRPAAGAGGVDQGAGGR